MSLVPEQWALWGTAEEDGRPVVYVVRHKLDREKRLTVWKLTKFAKRGWRSVGQFISTGRYRDFPERYGVPLTDSRIDRTLLAFALEADTIS